MADLLPTMSAIVGVLIGAVLTPRVTAGQAHREWLRDKRAATYEKYAEVLQQVTYVVNYDDALNFRLGNEGQKQLHEASRGLDRVTSDFAVYASEEIKSRSESIRHLFWDWDSGVVIRPLRAEERSKLPPDEQRRFDSSPWEVAAHPLEDDYPWPRIKAAGEAVVTEMEELLATIRSELRVTEAPWYQQAYVSWRDRW